MSTAKEQVLPRPDSVVGEQGGPAATPQYSTHNDATIPITEALVDEVLSVPETQKDRLSFPNLHATTEEEEDDDDDDEEDNGEDDDEDGNGKEGNQNEDEDKEDKKEDDA